MWKTTEGGDFKCSRIIARAMQVNWSARLTVLYRSRFSVSTSRMMLYHHTDRIGWYRYQCWFKMIIQMFCLDYNCFTYTTYYHTFCCNQSFFNSSIPSKYSSMDQIKEGTNLLIPSQDIKMFLLSFKHNWENTELHFLQKLQHYMPEIFKIEYVFKVSCLKIDLFCYFEYSIYI